MPALDTPVIEMESVDKEFILGGAFLGQTILKALSGVSLKLVRKRALFPEQHRYDDATLALDMRGLTAWLAERYAGFERVEDYFDSYSIAGERLAALQIPASILMAEDDPVIPYEDFRHWRLPAQAELEVARWGGHCAFVENLAGDGFAERWVAERLAAGLPRR